MQQRAISLQWPSLLQVVQLQELFDVRHSVFIVGNAGTGKSMVWKSLFKANQLMKKKPTAVDLNPKAVTNNELFGIINPATREWKDGELTCLINTAADVVIVCFSAADFHCTSQLTCFYNSLAANFYRLTVK